MGTCFHTYQTTCENCDSLVRAASGNTVTPVLVGFEAALAKSYRDGAFSVKQRVLDLLTQEIRFRGDNSAVSEVLWGVVTHVTGMSTEKDK